ncbi:MAG: hypothetical protein ACREDF_03705, partial [Thermoplasmata archaeon]
GVLLIVLAVIFFFLFIFLVGFILYFVLWVYGIYDAYQGAERFNRAHPQMAQPVMYAPPPPGMVPQPVPMTPPPQSSGQLACPECGRRYSPTQGRFCTVDGAELRPAM